MLILLALILYKSCLTAYTQPQPPGETPRPIRLTEAQARRAIADRVSVDNLTYQNDELRKANAVGDTLIDVLTIQNETLTQQVADDAATIKKQRRKIFWLNVGEWGTITGTIYLLIRFR